MHRILVLVFCFPLVFGVRAQEVTSRLQQAIKKLESDAQTKYSLIGFYVADAATGKEIFNRNGNVGLPIASSQKVITSITALELLGSDFRYKTFFGYAGEIQNGALTGKLHVKANGDPTLGSWRWNSTKDSAVFGKWVQAIRNTGIKSINGDIVAYGENFSKQHIPDGWIWQDIGNYYGTGAGAVNWHENQYDLFLKSGNSIGDRVEVLPAGSDLQAGPFENELTTAARGTGDNAYIYLPVGDAPALIKGTIPAGEKRFSISGALPDPVQQLKRAFRKNLSGNGIPFNQETADKNAGTEGKDDEKITWLTEHHSPALDSMNFWFLRRSINLYGEALVKTIALERNGYASTQQGIAEIKRFWAARGIDSAALNIEDGSGLSPLNRVTPSALVRVMRFAKSRPWFNSFYHALPEYNGIRMKSGTIAGVKSFTGFVKRKSGQEYCFAIVVSNYSGSSSSIVSKMYTVLNVLK